MSSSTRIARSRNILLLLAKSRVLNMLNAMVHTRPNITVILLGIIKQTLRPTLYCYELRSLELDKRTTFVLEKHK